LNVAQKVASSTAAPAPTKGLVSDAVAGARSLGAISSPGVLFYDVSSGSKKTSGSPSGGLLLFEQVALLTEGSALGTQVADHVDGRRELLYVSVRDWPQEKRTYHLQMSELEDATGGIGAWRDAVLGVDQEFVAQLVDPLADVAAPGRLVRGALAPELDWRLRDASLGAPKKISRSIRQREG
jgi:hypothetical protein